MCSNPSTSALIKPIRKYIKCLLTFKARIKLVLDGEF